MLNKSEPEHSVTDFKDITLISSLSVLYTNNGMENLTPQELQQQNPTNINQIKTSKRAIIISVSIAMLVIFGMAGFLIGSEVGKRSLINTDSSPLLPSPIPTGLPQAETQKQNLKEKYTIKKDPGNTSDPNSYKYELLKTDDSGVNQVIYSIVNWNGFNYQASEDNNYIAILNYGESLGDETFTLMRGDGKVIKEFGHLDSPQALIPFYWTDHYYWLSMGIPVGDPVGVIRVNADNLEVNRYMVSPAENK